jgi:hypothetical protein
MMPKVVSSIPELLAVVRDRQNALDLSNEVVEGIGGLSDRYLAKVLGPNPSKNFGEMSLGAVLGALALGIVRIEIAEDAEQRARISHRWKPRKRRPERKAAPA